MWKGRGAAARIPTVGRLFAGYAFLVAVRNCMSQPPSCPHGYGKLTCSQGQILSTADSRAAQNAIGVSSNKTHRYRPPHVSGGSPSPRSFEPNPNRFCPSHPHIGTHAMVETMHHGFPTLFKRSPVVFPVTAFVFRLHVTVTGVFALNNR